jgi:hypothetical protein
VETCAYNRTASEVIARFKNVLEKWDVHEREDKLVIVREDGTTVASVPMDTLCSASEEAFIDGMAKIAGHLGRRYGK